MIALGVGVVLFGLRADHVVMICRRTLPRVLEILRQRTGTAPLPAPASCKLIKHLTFTSDFDLDSWRIVQEAFVGNTLMNVR
jgi:hypothetical protein